MGTPWDRAAAGYVAQWMPRFVPYHLDLVRELTLSPGQRVLVTSTGPGAEVLAVARAVGEGGRIRATDSSEAMVSLCKAHVDAAALPARVTCEQADASDVTGGPFDAIVCSFGLWQYPDRGKVVAAWKSALADNGKVGVITWGPPEADDPFELMSSALREVAPAASVPDPRVHAERKTMASMFELAGLELARHAVVRHTLTFRTAEEFVVALREGCTWRRVWEELDHGTYHRVAARFFEQVGGPDAPLTFRPPATVAIACLPGAPVELEAVPSRRSAPPRS